MDKKIIITGGTGLIGQHVISTLISDGYDVYATYSREKPNIDNVTWIKCDILNYNDINNLFLCVNASYLMHLAWVVEGDFFNSNLNFDFIVSGINILKAFKLHGGKRAIYTGTGTEYDYSQYPINENYRLKPQSIYASCKNSLREIAEVYCKNNNIEFLWCRIFNVIGYNKNKTRLTAYIINNLLEDKEVTINNGNFFRDYIYTKDLAFYLVELLKTNTQGAINVCSGTAVKLEDYAIKIAKLLNKEHLLKINTNTHDKNIVNYLGNNNKLLSIVEKEPKYSIDSALDDILDEIKNKELIK